MPKANGQILWEEWKNCARCSFPHPLSMLSMQKGLLLCSCHGCVDNLDVERRPQMIQEALGNGEEGLSKIGEKASDSGEVTF